MNLDLEQPKTVGEPLVVVVVAVVGGGERLRDDAADIDHYRETVDADTTDPAVERDDQDDPAAAADSAERGDQGDPGDRRTAVAGVAVGAAAVDAVELSLLEHSGPTHLQE